MIGEIKISHSCNLYHFQRIEAVAANEEGGRAVFAQAHIRADRRVLNPLDTAGMEAAAEYLDLAMFVEADDHPACQRHEIDVRIINIFHRPQVVLLVILGKAQNQAMIGVILDADEHADPLIVFAVNDAIVVKFWNLADRAKTAIIKAIRNHDE